jgi:hypothetical protein
MVHESEWPLPAHEWNFSDVNPPVQAWAALAVFRIDGAQDFDFLARVFNKLLINFTWWVNREDARSDNIFEGGFLALDNIGPFDRSVILPSEVLEQSDGTAWMAKFCLNMLELALLLSRYHQEHPLVLDFDRRTSRLDYEPGESCSGLFGGNSNWRGHIWFPLNFLAIESLRHLHAFFGEDLTVQLPTGSGKKVNLNQVSTKLERRLLSLFLLDPNGRCPAHGANPRFQNDPEWRDSLLFYEYFNRETGEGLGASHQTGWTALAGALVANRRVRLSPQPKT